MGSASVTILVQSVIILVLGAAAFLGWRFAWKQFNRAEELADCNRTQAAYREKLERQIEERAHVQQIPLAVKPKKVDDSVIRARSAAQVRQVTEQKWGKKPGDEDERVN